MTSPVPTTMTPRHFRAIRKRRGLTQSQWAAALGMTQRNVRRIEIGEDDVRESLTRLVLLVDALGDTPPDFEKMLAMSRVKYGMEAE